MQRREKREWGPSECGGIETYPRYADQLEKKKKTGAKMHACSSTLMSKGGNRVVRVKRRGYQHIPRYGGYLVVIDKGVCVVIYKIDNATLATMLLSFRLRMIAQ